MGTPDHLVAAAAPPAPAHLINMEVVAEEARNATLDESSAVIDSDMIQCPICLSLLCEPISLVCGHTFCRPCLAQALAKSRKKCPSCRAVCHISAYSAKENVLLSNIARTCFPEQYAERLPEVQAARSDMELEMPVFYYNATRYPGHVISLHLFEERYRVMMQRVVESTNCFAYLPNFSDYHARAGDVGLVAKIDECQFYPDGRCDMQATLCQRFRVESHWVEEGTHNLTYVKIKYIEDEEPEQEPLVQQTAGQILTLLNQLFSYPAGQQLRDNTTSDMPPQTQAVKFSFWIADLVSKCFRIPHQTEQQLLSTTDTAERLELLSELVEHILEIVRTNYDQTYPDGEQVADDDDQDDQLVNDDDQAANDDDQLADDDQASSDSEVHGLS